MVGSMQLSNSKADAIGLVYKLLSYGDSFSCSFCGILVKYALLPAKVLDLDGMKQRDSME